MKNRGQRQRINCLSRAWEHRLIRADHHRGRQADRLLVEDGREEYEDEREDEAEAAREAA